MELSLEQQNKLKRLEFQNGFLLEAISQRLSMLLTIASLSVGVLVIATFGDNIITLNKVFFKIALTVLLIVILLALRVHLHETEGIISSWSKVVKDITGINPIDEIKKIKEEYNWFEKIINLFVAYFSEISFWLLSLVILYIIIEIWF